LWSAQTTIVQRSDRVLREVVYPLSLIPYPGYTYVRIYEGADEEMMQAQPGVAGMHEENKDQSQNRATTEERRGITY